MKIFNKKYKLKNGCYIHNCSIIKMIFTDFVGAMQSNALFDTPYHCEVFV